MLSPTKVAVIIPCFNEARFIGAVVEQVRKVIPNVVVVDDHSSDDTAKLATRAGARVLRNEQQLCKGGSLLRGLELAFAEGFEWALLMDGDGQHSPEDIERFLSLTPTAPLVIGNRMSNCELMPFVRKMVNRWMSNWISDLAGCDVPDTQCGFRLLNLSVWHELSFQTRRFEIESEMVVAFARAGHLIGSVPIQVIYRDEQSKISPMSDTIRWFQWYFKTSRNLKGPPLKASPRILTNDTAQTLP